MKLRKILLGALLLCNCQMANSVSAASRVKVSSQDNHSNHLLAQARKGLPASVALGEGAYKLRGKPTKTAPQKTLSEGVPQGDTALSEGVSFRAHISFRAPAAHSLASYADVGSLLFLAQISPDSTLGDESSTVVSDTEVQGVPADLIEGGAGRGANLFHSFEEFNVGDGQSVYFANPEGIANIFSRVTGNDVSDIMGTLGVDGGADLFLINPNGIIFGENASLNINGSFTASTADSILFGNDEFSASDPNEPPLLTVNMPVGLNLGNNPGSIVNRSTAENSEGRSVGLSVLAGNNLSFIGGDTKLEGGQATTPGGKVELGGLSTAGTVNISENDSLTFPEDVAKANISLSNDALVNVASSGGRGSIIVNARNLNLTENSFLKAGIAADSVVDNAQAGDIEIYLNEALTLDLSRILNQVEPDGVGNAGQIKITTGSIRATNGGQIDGTTSGRGNAGKIAIDATGDLTFDGEGSDNLDSSVVSIVNENAVGMAGDVTITTKGNLMLTNGGRVDVSSNGQGDGGNITIDTVGNLDFIGEDSEELGSGVTSLVNPQAAGNSGNITISTEGNFTLTDRGRVDVSNNSTSRGNAGNIEISVGGNLTIDGEKNSKSFGSGFASVVNESQGDSGYINVSTEGNLNLTNGGQISTNVNARGNGGDITINTMGDINFDGDDINGNGSGAISLVGRGVEGDAGDITISSQGKLSLTNGGRIDASSNEGRGNAGLITITATDDILFTGENSQTFGSGATSQVNPGVEGNSGGITIFTEGDLTLKDGGRVDTSTNAQGNAGFINITALGDITFEGQASDGDGSGVTSQVNPQATGNAGGVTISTQGDLTLRDGGRIDVSINTQENEINTNVTDNANIDLQVAENIFLDSNSLISAKALGNADGGNLNIDTKFIVAVPNSNNDIIANAEQGQGGNISIDARSIFGIKERLLNNSTNDINASSEFNSSGTVEIDILETNPSQDSLNIPVAPTETKIAQICDLDNDRNGLVVTGRGGVPNSPETNLNSGFALEDWRIDEASSGSSGRSLLSQSEQNTSTTKPIVEADRWLINSQGKVVLIAANNSSQSGDIAQPSTHCSAK